MQFIVAVSTGWATLWLVAHMLTITASQDGGITVVVHLFVFSFCQQSPHVLKKPQKTFTIYFCSSSSFSRRRGCWLDQGGQNTYNGWGRSWFKVWRSTVWALQGRQGRKSPEKYARCLALYAFSSFFFPFKWLQCFRFLADRTEVGWSRRSSKGNEKKPLWNFKKGMERAWTTNEVQPLIR